MSRLETKELLNVIVKTVKAWGIQYQLVGGDLNEACADLIYIYIYIYIYINFDQLGIK
jgi:hypothetical protein